MEIIRKYKSFNGKIFDSEDECVKYEQEECLKLYTEIESSATGEKIKLNKTDIQNFFHNVDCYMCPFYPEECENTREICKRNLCELVDLNLGKK